jgi:hypothetical protein
MKKLQPRGGRRPRNALLGVKEANDSQRWLIYELIKVHGGLAAITDKCAAILENDEFSVQNFSNWRRRGYVPVEYAFALATELGVSPRALNFKSASKILGKKVTWKEVVQQCKIFDAKLKREILSHKEPTL